MPVWSALWNEITTPGGGASSIDDLTDVDTATASPATGQVLAWNGTNWIPVSPTSGGPISLNDIVDVDTASSPPIAGEQLIWNGSAWIPGGDTLKFPPTVISSSTTSTVALIPNTKARAVKWFVAVEDNISGKFAGREVFSVRDDSTGVSFTEYAFTGDPLNFDISVSNDGVNVSISVTNNEINALDVIIVTVIVG